MRIINLVILLLKEFLRQPMYFVSTLLFPSMFFWFFGVPNAKDAQSSLLLTASFATFGCLGVVLFQLAVQISHERELSWSTYLRTLPVRPIELLSAKIIASMLIAHLAIAAVFLTASVTTSIDFSSFHFGRLLVTFILGSIPFGLIGITIGYLVKGNAAVPIANMIYLPLSFAGGLWLPPQSLPKIIQDFSVYLPTRLYAELVWAVAFHIEQKMNNVIGLAIYGVVFLIIATLLYRQNEAVA